MGCFNFRPSFLATESSPMKAMRWHSTRTQITLALTILLTVGGLIAQSYGQDESLSVTYSPHAAASFCHMNMGPTGATAWMRGHHFVVVSIQQGSPGYDRLMLGDVVTGTTTKAFGEDADSRMTLGAAIAQAEATGRPLKLAVLREGEPRVVSIELPKLGAYSSTWPTDCPRSAAILDEACQSLLNTQMPSGSQVTDSPLGMFLSGLLFLSTGEAEYLDAARRAAQHASELDYTKIDYNNWSMGYGAILMAEYYLATGDDTVLPKLQKLATTIGEGQMLCGSWGHSSPAGGYGALNQPGITCAIALVLAKECGITIDEAALNKALDFFSRFAATGAVPYGDGWPSRGLDDNGRNATAALLFHLAGKEDIAQQFAASVAESYWNREQGHTGGYFSMMWGPLATRLVGEQKLQTFLDYQKWYYDLIRKWNGELTFLPYREALTRFDSSTYVDITPRFTTGGLGLVYAMPHKKLRILGAQKSVFGAKLTGDLKTARDLYVARDWKGCDKVLSGISPTELADAEAQWWAQLAAARGIAMQSIDRTLAEIDCNIEEGGAYRASIQFEALKRAYGKDADPRFAAVEQRLAEGSIPWYIREGRQYYEALEGIIAYSVRGWTPQGRQAQRLLEGMPPARLAYWQPLSATSQLTPQTWRTKLYEPDAALDDGWEKPGFDDSSWMTGEGIVTRFTGEWDETPPRGPIAARRTFTIENLDGAALRVRLRTVRRALTKVYLNGTLIVDVERGQRGGYASILLDDRVMSLLKRGKNVLAVTSTQQGPGNNHLDVSLEIQRRPLDKHHRPIERAERIRTEYLPDVDASLRVADAAHGFRDKLKQSYADKSVDQLIAEMGNVVFFHRAMAEDALIAKGMDAIKQAVAKHDSPDWKTRSSVVLLMDKALAQFKKDANEEGIAYIHSQAPVLIALAKDDNVWVRANACKTLGDFGEDAAEAIPLLLDATDDTHEWVRQAALGSLNAVGADDTTMLKAMQQAVRHVNSSFSIPNRTILAIGQIDAPAKAKLAVLVELIKQPAEGGGGSKLSEAMTLACELDPAGHVIVPVLMDAAADKTHLSRHRGNPRGKAIELLGSYGPKAVAAVRVLRDILSDESDRAAKYHEAAKAALESISAAD
jgi:hypothetical protein